MIDRQLGNFPPERGCPITNNSQLSAAIFPTSQLIFQHENSHLHPVLSDMFSPPTQHPSDSRCKRGESSPGGTTGCLQAFCAPNKIYSLTLTVNLPIPAGAEGRACLGLKPAPVDGARTRWLGRNGCNTSPRSAGTSVTAPSCTPTCKAFARLFIATACRCHGTQAKKYHCKALLLLTRLVDMAREGEGGGKG